MTSIYSRLKSAALWVFIVVYVTGAWLLASYNIFLALLWAAPFVCYLHWQDKKYWAEEEVNSEPDDNPNYHTTWGREED